MSEGKKEYVYANLEQDINGQLFVKGSLAKLDVMKSIQEAKSYVQDMSSILSPMAFPFTGSDKGNHFNDDTYGSAFREGMGSSARDSLIGNGDNGLTNLGTEDGWSGMPTRFKLRGNNNNSDGGIEANNQGEGATAPMEKQTLKYLTPDEFVPSKNVINLLKNYEQLRLKKYDAGENDGIMTIGYGHRDINHELPNEITREKAEQLLHEDLLGDKTYFLRKFLKDNNIKVTQQQYDALVLLTFNIGDPNWHPDITDFKVKRLLLEGNWGREDMEEAFLRWIKVGSTKNAGLYRRRKDEVEVMFDGEYKRNHDRSYPEGYE